MNDTIMKNTLPAPTFRWLKVNEAEPDPVTSVTLKDDRVTVTPGASETKLIELCDPEDGLLQQTTTVTLEKNASLKLFIVQRAGVKTQVANRVRAVLKEGASLSYVRIVLSGPKTLESLECELEGKKSSLEIQLGYFLKDRESLDVNYLASHKGIKTRSAINVSGVMKDHSEKLFRGTIDFIKGAKGAVGDELEDVLLMDPGVINKTVPLILCAEEDVVGNHGATIGRLPEELLFYMGSRGLSREEIYAMIAAGRMHKLIRLLPDGKLKEELEELYGEKDEGN